MMNKKMMFAIVSLVVVGVAWWLLSPLWRNVRLDEPVPTGSTGIKDNLESMDAATRKEFSKATEAMKDKKMTVADPMPSSAPVIVARAPMVARAHGVKGEALLVGLGNNQHALRFENLDTINGPDLRIYLSAGLSAGDVVDLGPIRATQGNVNYTIPPGTDITKYKNALIWCRAFSVLFSYAQL